MLWRLFEWIAFLIVCFLDSLLNLSLNSPIDSFRSSKPTPNTQRIKNIQLIIDSHWKVFSGARLAVNLI